MTSYHALASLSFRESCSSVVCVRTDDDVLTKDEVSNTHVGTWAAFHVISTRHGCLYTHQDTKVYLRVHVNVHSYRVGLRI